MSRFGQSPTVFEWNRIDSLVPVFQTIPQELQTAPHLLSLSLNKIESPATPVLMNPIQAQLVNSSTTSYWSSFSMDSQTESEFMSAKSSTPEGTDINEDNLQTSSSSQEHIKQQQQTENSQQHHLPIPHEKAESDKEFEEEDDDMTIDDLDDYEDDSMDYNDDDDEERDDNFESGQKHHRLRRLASSKSPIIEALVFCALKGWGIQLLTCNQNDISFKVTNFAEYYKMSARICSKQNPTEDEASRIKALKRWFPDFPTRRGRKDLDGEFIIHVGKGTSNDNKPKKLKCIIDKTKKLIGPSSKQTKLR